MPGHFCLILGLRPVLPAWGGYRGPSDGDGCLLRKASGPNKHNVSLLYKQKATCPKPACPIQLVKSLIFLLKNKNLKTPQLLIHLPIDMRDENNFGWP